MLSPSNPREYGPMPAKRKVLPLTAATRLRMTPQAIATSKALIHRSMLLNQKPPPYPRTSAPTLKIRFSRYEYPSTGSMLTRNRTPNMTTSGKTVEIRYRISRSDALPKCNFESRTRSPGISEFRSDCFESSFSTGIVNASPEPRPLSGLPHWRPPAQGDG